MKVHQLLDRYGITENPFAQEDAQTDAVFRDHCLEGVHHPAWDKIFGRADAPATSVVFGEKGSGKTALRMQMVAAIEKHNTSSELGKRTWVIQYDDFNPFLDCFRENLRGNRRKPEKALKNWKLWDHIDCVLSLGVTRLMNSIISDHPQTDRGTAIETTDEQLSKLSHSERRDLLLLVSLYDRSLDMPRPQRWGQLRKKLDYANWKRLWDVGAGVGVTILSVFLFSYFGDLKSISTWGWMLGVAAAGWLPWAYHQLSLWWRARSVARQIRVLDHQVGTLRSIFGRFLRDELTGQPLPMRNRSDDRYELLLKFQNLLRTLGYPNMMVFVDRVDEPHLIDGEAERMRDLLWPMFDNKLLKHQDMAFKLLLPAEVYHLLQRQEKQFFERSRLDKQNLVASLSWSGEGLYDIVNDRIKACAELAETPPVVLDLFEESITKDELISTFATLHVPRHLFKFLYRLLVEHCSRFTDDSPTWKISRETLSSTLAVFRRDLADYERGTGTV